MRHARNPRMMARFRIRVRKLPIFPERGATEIDGARTVRTLRMAGAFTVPWLETSGGSDVTMKAGASKKPIENEDQDSFLQRLGPGLITGASDDDPSGIGTYSQAGAQLGFGIGWTMLITYPLMAAIQEISGRIGRVTGHGIAGNVCRNFGAVYVWSLVGLLFVANIINIAADLGAMADALLIGGPGIAHVVLFGAVSVVAQIFFNYDRDVSVLKWLTLSLFAYVIALAVVRVPWGAALKGILVPPMSLDAAFLTTLVAILGTTISPYLFVWQS